MFKPKVESTAIRSLSIKKMMAPDFTLCFTFPIFFLFQLPSIAVQKAPKIVLTSNQPGQRLELARSPFVVVTPTFVR